MTIRGKLRGLDVAIRLTKSEAKVFERARIQGFLIVLGRLGMVEHAWQVYCWMHWRPCIIVRLGRSTASITVDFATTRDFELCEAERRAVRLTLFKASCQAPNAAAKGRIRRAIITSNYVYSRVPLVCAEATARALLKIRLSETEESRRRPNPFELDEP